MGKFIPPASTVPSPCPPEETHSFVFAFVFFAQKKWPIEIKYVEKGVIIEHVY
jgi:hypothetical protein